MGLEELEISELDQVEYVYSALLCSHVRLLKYLLPGVAWKEVPVIVVFEQNTYVNSLVTVKNTLEQALVHSGVKLCFYHKWSQSNNKYMLGKHVGAKVKLEMVLATVFSMTNGKLSYCDTVMSVGWAVLAEAVNRDASSRLNATLDIAMYRKSRRGINLSSSAPYGAYDNTTTLALSADGLTDTRHANEGKSMLGKLRNELMMVTITKAQRSGGSLVSTGGKRSVNGQYTRDDMLSAVLLLCHTRDELLVNNNNLVRIQSELYYE